ncbi:MAG: hypothetical protein D6796_16275 [Caldilineae bacterium]|nr:MAG: hypothetical protein D6796_16275 [Caldilineae bacterium]
MANDHRLSSPSVPVLITWDVDPDTWVAPAKRRLALERAIAVCAAHNIPATFFFTASAADVYRGDFNALAAQGHEIGCHGLTHGSEEDYDRMPEAMQRDYLTRATDHLQNLTGTPMRVFRSPRVKTSAITLRLLAELGYLSDSSVCSQRADVVSSNLVNIGWLLAPRRPYRPHPDNPFRRGDVPLWEVPVSAAILPFISSTMGVLGFPAMKFLFNLLYAESKVTGKPIVYLMHPTEFLSRADAGSRKRWKQALNPRHFSPTHLRTHGLAVRHLFRPSDGGELYRRTDRLFAHMASFPAVRFMTLGQYVAKYLENGHAG